MVNQTINLDFANEEVQPRLYASQGDTGERIFSIRCFMGNEKYIIPENSVVTINGRKPGNTIFIVPGTYVDNVVTFDCTAGMTDTRGYVMCELAVVTDAGITQSANFVLYVEREVIEGGSDLSALFKLLEQKQDKLTPGTGIRIYIDETTGELTIAATGGGGGGEYFEGTGIKINDNNEISIDPDVVQQKLIEGNGINIASDGTISVDPDAFQIKLKPGDRVTIEEDGTITFEGMTKEEILEALGMEEKDIEFEETNGRKLIIHTIGEIEEVLPTFTVTFDSDGGTPVDPQEVTMGELATEPTPPTRGTDTFLGWLNGSELFDFATPIMGNTILTADWEV